jgi:hypothetical protein
MNNGKRVEFLNCNRLYAPTQHNGTPLPSAELSQALGKDIWPGH